MDLTTRHLRALFAAAAVLVVAISMAACGSSSENLSNIAEGEPVKLGELEYNVLFSRFLNPKDVEDQEYLVGQPELKPGELYLGVFIQVKNKDADNAHPLPSAFVVNDTLGNTFPSLTSDSIYAMNLGDDIGAKDQIPALDSSAQVGPIQGSMVLFLVPDSANQNRPLRLLIPSEGESARVSLDI